MTDRKGDVHMKIATTTADFGYGCKNDTERIRALYEAGFRYIDFSMYSLSNDSVYMGDGWREAVRALRTEAEALGMRFVQAHSPGGNPLTNDPDRLKSLTATTLRSIEICELLGIENTVVHTGFGRGISKEEWFERNREFYRVLFPYMEHCGVNVLIENSTRANMGEMYFTNTGKDMREFLSFADHPQLHACWDTGHGNCEGAQYEEILTLGEELYAIHYNDNRGTRDDHMLPYLGTMNHDEIMNALLAVGYRGYFTLECTSSMCSMRARHRGRTDFPWESPLGPPPLFLQRGLEALLYETAKYILSAYGAFEE